MKNVFENLNEQQVKAVSQIEGPMLVLAGAGSGKTTVLTRRIINMIENGISPKNILAITFSNKAAEEMRSRIYKNVPNNQGKDVKVKTFHALCAEILRNEKKALGLYIFHKEVPNFVICSSDECLAAVYDALVETKFLGFPGITPEGMQKRIDSTKNLGITVEDVRQQWLQNNEYITDVFKRIYSCYQQILQRNNSLDFNDLIMYVLELFEKQPELLKKYQEKFRYIMVDEYQDTNHLQYELVQMLAFGHHNLCVVGDDDQSIYGFRGADISNILNFEQDYPDATVIKLEQNYRSSEYIVDIANSVITNNKNRLAKTMHSNVPNEAVLQLGHFSTAEREAAEVAKSIETSYKQGIPYNEIAVLYRINSISKPIERELTKRGIPYRLLRGTGLLQHKETKDVLSYLKLIDNSHDDLAFKRIINVPSVRVPDRAMETLSCFARKNGISLWAALNRSNEIWPNIEVPCNISCFIRMIEYLQESSKEMSIHDLIEEVLDKTGYRDFIIKNIMKYSMQYIDDLLAFAKIFDEKSNNEKSLNEFLEQAAFMTDADNNPDIDAVSLLSGHGCKGLEFDLVYIIGMEDGILPHQSAIEGGDRFDAMEEERRLFYVMVTRAKKYLFITSAKVRALSTSGLIKQTDYRERMKSRFIGELGVEVK